MTSFWCHRGKLPDSHCLINSWLIQEAANKTSQGFASGWKAGEMNILHQSIPMKTSLEPEHGALPQKPLLKQFRCETLSSIWGNKTNFEDKK